MLKNIQDHNAALKTTGGDVKQSIRAGEINNNKNHDNVTYFHVKQNIKCVCLAGIIAKLQTNTPYTSWPGEQTRTRVLVFFFFCG